MRQSFTIPMPPTLNEQIDLARSHWSKSAAAKRRHDAKVAQVAKGLIRYQSGPLYIMFHWQVKTRRSDADNTVAAAKYIMDGLVKAKVIPGDSLMTIPGPWVSTFGKGENVVTVTIGDSPIVLLAIIPEVPA
jgi:Holliday junction resolvase RusA-like endonuclease